MNKLSRLFKLWWILLVGLFLILTYFVNAPNYSLDIRKCDFNERYNLKGYNNIGESMNLKDDSIYANLTMIPKVGDIVVVNQSFSDGATGFVHRIKAKIGNYYLIKGDNNNIYDGFYNKNRIKGVVICQDE